MDVISSAGFTPASSLVICPRRRVTGCGQVAARQRWPGLGPGMSRRQSVPKSRCPRADIEVVVAELLDGLGVAVGEMASFGQLEGASGDPVDPAVQPERA